jgi:signal transduction histidine kinase
LFRLSTAFYTTKATGTGLGLWISSSIIENHGGILVPLRNDGHGMTFRFYLPIESPASDSTESIAGEDFTTLSRQGMRE